MRAIHEGLPLVPWHMGLYMELFTWQDTSLRRASERARESTRKTEIMILCNLITEENSSLLPCSFH